MSRVATFCVLAGGGIVLPYFLPAASGLASVVLLFIALATGLNLELGLAGLPDFAVAGYGAIGAGCGALLMGAFGLPFWACLPLTGAVPAAISLALVWPLLRLRPEIFAMITLGFAALMQIALINGTAAIGSGALSFPDVKGATLYYYVVLAVGLISGALSWLMGRSPLGLALRAAREDEPACHSIGLDPRRCKQIVVAISAFIAGIAGCLLAAGQGSIRPDDFDLSMTASLFAIVILGARPAQLGILFAATVIAGAPQLFPAASEFRLLACGAGLMLWTAAKAVSWSRSLRPGEGVANFTNIVETPAE